MFNMWFVCLVGLVAWTQPLGCEGRAGAKKGIAIEMRWQAAQRERILKHLFMKYSGQFSAHQFMYAHKHFFSL